jgi:hypothetical protein
MQMDINLVEAYNELTEDARATLPIKGKNDSQNHKKSI